MSTEARTQAAPEPETEKMSAKVLGVSDGFIEAGNTLHERQSRLIALCSAWNMACGNPETLQQQLDSWSKNHAKLNPSMTADDIADKVRFLRVLIGRKQTLYPDEKRQILEACVVPVGDSFRVEVAFARLPG